MGLLEQVNALMEENNNDEAIHLLQGFLPEANDEEKFSIAEFYWQWGFLQEAQDILEGLNKDYPAESEIKIMLADIYIELEDDKAAINILDEIHSEDPAYVQALLQLADLYQSEGLFEVAEQKLLEAQKHDPEEPIITFALGEFLFSIGDFKRAITFYEKLYPEMEQLADVSIPTRIAEANASIGKYETALTYFAKIKNESPDFLFKYGLTAYQANRKDIAINVWEKVIKIDDNYHSVYYELAKAYNDEELIEEAFETCEKGLVKDEFNKELFYFAGILANKLNKMEKSENYIRQAIVLDPDYKQAILFLIELFKETDRHDEIIDMLQDIKNHDVYDPLYEWELASAYNAEEKYEDAFIHYKEAYNSLENEKEFLKEYGYFLTEEGQREEAITIFTNYLKLEPLDIEVEEYLSRLKQTHEE